jgi:hypothetical protein
MGATYATEDPEVPDADAYSSVVGRLLVAIFSSKLAGRLRLITYGSL